MTFTQLKDACAEHFFNLTEQLQAIRILLESDDPPMRVIEQNCGSMQRELDAWFGKHDSAAMREHSARPSRQR